MEERISELAISIARLEEKVRAIEVGNWKAISASAIAALASIATAISTFGHH